MTIDQVFKREIGEPLALKEKLEKINYLRDDLIKKCKETGIVDMSQFAQSVRDTLKYENRSIGEDIIDGTRNRLRNAGAVGIGDDTGVYVMARPENSEEIKKAILLRYESLVNDFESIKAIAKASKTKMSYKDFDSGANWSFHNKIYIVNILLSFIDMGIISDISECIAAIDKTSLQKEVSSINKLFRVSRKQYIEFEYKKYFSADGVTE